MQNKSLKSPYTFTIKSKVKVSFLIFQKYTEMRSIVTTRHWVGAGRGCYPEMTKSNVRTISGEIYSAFIILTILKLDIFRFSHHHPRNLNCLARNRLKRDMHEMRHIFPII